MCSGVTAYTTDKVTSLHGLIYAALVSSVGEERARAYGEANQAAIERIAGLVAERAIDCDFSRRAATPTPPTPAPSARSRQRWRRPSGSDCPPPS